MDTYGWTYITDPTSFWSTTTGTGTGVYGTFRGTPVYSYGLNPIKMDDGRCDDSEEVDEFMSGIHVLEEGV